MVSAKVRGVARNFYLEGAIYDTNLLVYTNFHNHIHLYTHNLVFFIVNL